MAAVDSTDTARVRKYLADQQRDRLYDAEARTRRARGELVMAADALERAGLLDHSAAIRLRGATRHVESAMRDVARLLEVEARA
jgi:hypothetical protein